MRKYILTFLIFVLTSCTSTQRQTKQTESTPSNKPASTLASATATTLPILTPANPAETAVSSPKSRPADLRGIYVDSNAFPISAADSTALSAALNVPGVDGLVLVLGWDGIEPSMNQYQWSTLDQWMSMAVSANKKVELSIRADFHTPAWLFQPAPGGAGARPLNF